MPENEFEKKVSSELQELRFKPSDTVWMKVEERIKKKKRRRVFIILFLLAGIALLGYWQWDNFFGVSKATIVHSETPTQEKNNSANENTQSIKKEDNKPDNETTEIKKDVNTKVNEQVKVTIKDNSTNKTESSISKLDIFKKKIVDGKRTVSPVADKRKNDRTKPPQKKVVTLTETDLAILTTDEPAIVKDSAKVKHITADDVVQDTAQKTIIPDNKTDSIKVDTLAKKVDIKKDTVAKKIDSVLKAIPADSPVVSIPKKPLNKKWNLGIEFNPGISSFNETFFAFSMNKSADLYSAPQSGSGFPTPPASPSKRHAGFAFRLGGFAEKQFSKRSGLSLGLRFAYYSDNLEIGPRRLNISNNLSVFLDMQGANQAFGAAGDTIHFTDRYHFIEVPVYYKLRLNKNESYPFTLQAGLKIGHLIGSNALAYDTVASGIYYRSDKYINKTQLGFSASLNWTIMNKQKIQWTLGPVTDIHFNSLLNSPFEEKKYLMFAGLRTSIKFDSKK